MEGKITGNRKKIRKNPENHGCSVQYTVITVEAKNRNASTARNDFRRLKNYHVLSFRRKGGRVSKRTKRYTFPSRAKISNSSRDRCGRSSASGEWEEIAERDWAATANESKHPLPNLSPRLPTRSIIDNGRVFFPLVHAFHDCVIVLIIDRTFFDTFNHDYREFSKVCIFPDLVESKET